jgi:hypothetical protein
MFVSVAFVSVDVLMFLAFLYVVIGFEKELTRSVKIIAALIPLYALFAGIAAGFYYTVFIFLPYFIYLIVSVIVSTSFKKILNYKALWLAICAAANAAGVAVQLFALNGTVGAKVPYLTLMSDWFRNIGAIYPRFLNVAGGLPDGVFANITALSSQGIYYMVNHVIFLGILGFFIWGVTYAVKNRLLNNIAIVIMCVLFVHLVLTDLSFNLVGNRANESQYYIIAFVGLIVGCAAQGDRMKRGQIQLSLVFTVVFAVLLFSNVSGGRNYLKTASAEQRDILNLLTDEEYDDVGLVYFVNPNSNELNCDFMGRNMRVLDSEKVYKLVSYNADNKKCSVYHDGGDYTYYDEQGSYLGGTLIITASEIFDALPASIRNAYTLSDVVSGFNVYKGDSDYLQPSDKLYFQRDYDAQITIVEKLVIPYVDKQFDITVKNIGTAVWDHWAYVNLTGYIVSEDSERQIKLLMGTPFERLIYPGEEINFTLFISVEEFYLPGDSLKLVMQRNGAYNFGKPAVFVYAEKTDYDAYLSDLKLSRTENGDVYLSVLAKNIGNAYWSEQTDICLRIFVDNEDCLMRAYPAYGITIEKNDEFEFSTVIPGEYVRGGEMIKVVMLWEGEFEFGNSLEEKIKA